MGHVHRASAQFCIGPFLAYCWGSFDVIVWKIMCLSAPSVIFVWKAYVYDKTMQFVSMAFISIHIHHIHYLILKILKHNS